MSSYGELNWFLSLKIERKNKKAKRLKELREMYNLSNCRTLEIPLDNTSKLSKLEAREI